MYKIEILVTNKLIAESLLEKIMGDISGTEVRDSIVGSAIYEEKVSEEDVEDFWSWEQAETTKLRSIFGVGEDESKSGEETSNRKEAENG